MWEKKECKENIRKKEKHSFNYPPKKKSEEIG